MINLNSIISYLETGHLFPLGKARIGLLRVGVGVFMLWQLAGVVILTSPLFDLSAAHALLGLSVVLSVFLVLGLFVPFTSLLLLLTWAYTATVLQFWNLGVVATTWALFAIIVHGGDPTSIERKVIAYQGQISVLLQSLYRLWGNASPPRIFVSRWLSLWFFSLTAFYSVSLHRQDPVWQNGDVGPYLLASSYLSRFHSTWSKLFQDYGWISVGLGWLTTIFIYVFGLMALLVFFRGRVVAALMRIANLGFFVFSLVFLQLGTLPVVELLLWIFWFVPTIRSVQERPNRPFRFAVLYDDYCGLCQGTRRFLGFLDSTNVLLWIPASQVQDQLHRTGFSYAQATSDLIAIRNDGKIVTGYSCYSSVVWWIPAIWVLGPILLIGKVTRFGPLVYRWVRGRRERKVSFCKLTPQGDTRGACFNFEAVLNGGLQAGRETEMERRSAASKFWVLGLILGIAYVCTSPGVNSRFSDTAEEVEPPVVKSLRFSLGLQGINVFNSSDLKMSEHWVVFYASDGVRTEVIAITHEDGSRGWIQLIDAVYFGGTVVFRRDSIDRDRDEVCILALHYASIPYIRRALDLLTPAWSNFKSLTVYRQPLSPPTEAKAPPEVLCQTSLIENVGSAS